MSSSGSSSSSGASRPWRRPAASRATTVGSRPGDAPNVRRGQAWVTGGTSKKPVNKTALEHDAPGTGKRIIKVPYVLSKEEYDFLRIRFSGNVFQSSDDRNHDHPIAHTSTMVGTRQMQRMVFAGSNCLDVYGSPNSNDAFNASQLRSRNPKHVHTLVYEHSAKDALRRFTKWGPSHVAGVARYTEERLEECGEQFLEAFDTYMFVHTLYYVSQHQINGLLNLSDNANRRVLALVHRFDGGQGEFNNGEQRWVKDDRGYVQQTNVKSGEEYSHFSTDAWFGKDRVFQDHVAKTAFTWQLHMVCDGLWIVEACRCKYHYEASMAVPFGGQAGMDIELPTAASRTVGPITVIVGDGVTVSLNVSNADLYDKLCHWMVGKARNSETLRDLFVTARRAVTPGDLLPGVRGYDVHHSLVADHVIAAYLSGVDRELDLLGGVVYNAPFLQEHSSLMKGSEVFDISDVGAVLTKMANVAQYGYRAYKSNDPLARFLSMVG